MLLMGPKLTRLLFLIKQDAGLYLGISLGIYFFILFFQPFPLNQFDDNNRLLFVAGLAAIIYFSLILVRIILRWIISDTQQIYDEPFIHPGIEVFILWGLSSVAISFYLRYVGSVYMTFYIVFKVLIICLIPLLIIRLYDRIKFLRQENETLLMEKESLQQTLSDFEEDHLNKSIELASDSIHENTVFQLSDIILFKSADNYVEIIYREGAEINKTMIRSTLKNIESQLRQYPGFIRCHRTVIVNRYQVQRVIKKYNIYSLIMKGYEEEIPVSRQYLYKIKDLF